MRPEMLRTLPIALTMACGLFWTLGVKAADFPIDDENPALSVPSPEAQNGSPLEFGYWLMEVTDRAVKSQETGDLPRATRYYEALALAAPHRALAFSKLCQIYLTMRETDLARPHCEKAIATEGATSRDFERYLALLLHGSEDLSPEGATQIKEVLSHVNEQRVESPTLFELECKAAVRMEDQALLEQCTQGLARIAPEDARRLPFEFALAFIREDEKKAWEALERAKQSRGQDAAEVARMEQLVEALPRSKRRTQLAVVGAGLVIIGGLLTAAIAFNRLRRRRRTLHSEAPSGGIETTEAMVLRP